MLKIFRIIFFLLATTTTITCHAQQQAWPNKPLTFIVGYPPGGGADLIARTINSKMSSLLGQPIIIDNKPGSGGQIAATSVARSIPDGYTSLIDAAAFAINLALFPKLSYNEKSFETVGVIQRVPLVLVVNNDFPAKNVNDVIALAKSKPGTVFYASSGPGSLMHIATSLFMTATKTEMNHVPYKGAAQALTDVVSGQVPLYFCNATAALPLIKARKLRALAVTSSTRVAALPDIPNLTELGIKGVEIYEWNALELPTNTPTPIANRMSEALQQTIDSPEVKARIIENGGIPFVGTRVESIKFVNEEIQRMKKIVDTYNIKVE
jgi:tripartite-type tricarboxylate transporter receptor subunit TctC